MLISNEIVFKGHPDKVADQISDALLDAYLSEDPNSRCGIEVVGGKGKIFVTGEVSSSAEVYVEGVVKYALCKAGYYEDYEIINNLGVQSPDIAQGVDTGGAGDQGIMIGFACNETREMLPKAQVILQEFAKQYDELRQKDKRFLPDGKAQITGYYDNIDEILRLRLIEEFVISYQNTEEDRKATDKIIIKMAQKICKKYGVETNKKKFIINPTGKFLIGGFQGDAGLTGRKIVVDNYQAFSSVGGGAYSGKDCTKVDRSAAYKARQVAKRYVSMTGASWCRVSVSYAIGLEKPMSIRIETNKGDICFRDELYESFKPKNIIEDLGLRKVKYYPTSQFGHYGNKEFPWEQIK